MNQAAASHTYTQEHGLSISFCYLYFLNSSHLASAKDLKFHSHSMC